MSKGKDIFDKRLNELMHDRRERPSDEIWSRIEQTMAGLDAAAGRPAKREPVKIVQHRRRLGVRRMWYYGVAAALLLGIYLFNGRMVSLDRQFSEQELVGTVLYDPATDGVPQDRSSETVVKDDDAAVVRYADSRVRSRRQGYSALADNSAQTGRESASDALTGHGNAVSAVADATRTGSETLAGEDSGRESERGDAAAREREAETSRPDASAALSAQGQRTSSDAELYRQRVRELMAEESKRTKSGGRVSASLYASNLAGFGHVNAGNSPVATAGLNATELVNNDIGTYMASSGTQRRNTETRLDHQVPITVGITAQYGITDRWGIETGVTYTYMRSRAESKGIFDYDITQELHYIGVPLAASYKFVDTHWVEVYAKIGGALERCVSARRVYKYMNSNDENTGRQSEKIDYEGVQLSTFASVGAELKIGEWVGIYAEPGLGYYFDNDQPANYRTDNPFSVTLQAGLRFHFGEK